MGVGGQIGIATKQKRTLRLESLWRVKKKGVVMVIIVVSEKRPETERFFPNMDVASLYID